MKNKSLFLIFAVLLGLFSLAAKASCSRFTGSTMHESSGPIAEWRTDYPTQFDSSNTPWLAHDFTADPAAYMESVLSVIKPGFYKDGDVLKGKINHEWWISVWMDFTSFGREPRMGLTKERRPDKNDLAEDSADTYQVWAVGFYNQMGAVTIGEIFEDPCNPSVPVSVNFPRNTVSIKFLFTDANPDEVKYLEGAPIYKAMIDPSSGSREPKDREESELRLLQLDIAVKDLRASETSWVFGTFGWVGPKNGDGLFDNLVPVSLQWGNDPGVYDRNIKESWINPNMEGVMFGWKERPTLGFNGRANGPADNIRSSCLSCHASARTPRSRLGLLGTRFDPQKDINDLALVKAHVDTWFGNQDARHLFDSSQPAVSSLDYSLQLESAFYRMCQACISGDLAGDTPNICRESGFYNRSQCNTSEITAERSGLLTTDKMKLQKTIRMSNPPRQ